MRCTCLSTRGQGCLASVEPALRPDQVRAEVTPTFHVDLNDPADFELLVVDQDVELAGVDAGVRALHGRDQQLPSVRLEPGGDGVLPGGRNRGIRETSPAVKPSQRGRMTPLTLYHSISWRVLLKSLIDGQLNDSFSPTMAVMGK